MSSSSEDANADFAREKAVDMDSTSSFISTNEQPTWLRVDLDETYLVYEVLIRAQGFQVKGTEPLHGVDLRVGK